MSIECGPCCCRERVQNAARSGAGIPCLLIQAWLVPCIVDHSPVKRLASRELLLHGAVITMTAMQERKYMGVLCIQALCTVVCMRS